MTVSYSKGDDDFCSEPDLASWVLFCYLDSPGPSAMTTVKDPSGTRDRWEY